MAAAIRPRSLLSPETQGRTLTAHTSRVLDRGIAS